MGAKKEAYSRRSVLFRASFFFSKASLAGVVDEAEEEEDVASLAVWVLGHGVDGATKAWTVCCRRRRRASADTTLVGMVGVACDVVGCGGVSKLDDVRCDEGRRSESPSDLRLCAAR